jgi:hypothetical protein
MKKTMNQLVDFIYNTSLIQQSSSIPYNNLQLNETSREDTSIDSDIETPIVSETSREDTSIDSDIETPIVSETSREDTSIDSDIETPIVSETSGEDISMDSDIETPIVSETSREDTSIDSDIETPIVSETSREDTSIDSDIETPYTEPVTSNTTIETDQQKWIRMAMEEEAKEANTATGPMWYPEWQMIPSYGHLSHLIMKRDYLKIWL